MNQWQYLLLAALAGLWLLVSLYAAWRRGRLRRRRDFDRKLETVLKPRETVEFLFYQKKVRWILTSQRLLRESGEGFTAVPLKSIKRIKGVTKEGKATSAASKMAQMTIQAAQEYTFDNTFEEFPAFAKQLLSKTRKKPKAKRT